MKTAEALVTPSVLAWARETAGLSIDEAAAKFRLRAVQLEEWEQGVRAPTIRQAREAARVYRRPFALFFLDKPPREFRVPHDFRTARDPTQLSSVLRTEIRRVEFQRQLTVELAETWRIPDLT